MPAYLTAAFYKFVNLPDAAQLKVPLLAEVGVGANWDQAH